MKLTTKNLTHVLLTGAMACALAMLALGTGRATAQTTEPAAKADPNEITAIDILLEPDATMVQHAEAVNERLLKPRISIKSMPLSAKSSPAPM